MSCLGRFRSVGIGVVVALAGSASLHAVADFESQTSGTITIVQIQDETGAVISAPPGLDIIGILDAIIRSTFEDSGDTALIFGGSAAVTGTGGATQVALVSQVVGGAFPVGAVSALEQVSGRLRFTNSTEQLLTITVQYDYLLSVSANVSDPVSETASSLAQNRALVFDCLGLEPVEIGFLSEQANAPPGGGLVLGPGSFSADFEIEDGQTCDVEGQLITRGEARSPEQMVPTLPLLGAGMLAIALLAAGGWWLRHGRAGTGRP